MIDDGKLKRRIRATKSGSLPTVAWAPWTAKTDRMGDMGQPDGWRRMVCVESADTIGNAVKVAAGAGNILIVEYCAESL